MAASDRHRAKAEEMLRLAATVSTSSERLSCLELASHWLELARQAEVEATSTEPPSTDDQTVIAFPDDVSDPEA
jgi:hypothetical protein